MISSIFSAEDVDVSSLSDGLLLSVVVLVLSLSPA